MSAAASEDSQKTVLVVEDDTEILDLVASYLSQQGFDVLTAGHGVQMRTMIAEHSVDLIILDINLPGEDGFDICAQLRRTSDVPIIMLTARAEKMDCIIGLEVGADDYVTKPFNPRELLARVKARLRRPAGAPDRPATGFCFDGWDLDRPSRSLTNPSGVRIGLTAAEFELLVALCEHAGQILPRDRVADRLPGQSAAAAGRSIDVLVSRLRQKIEDNPREPRIIKTIRSAGYMFTRGVEPR